MFYLFVTDTAVKSYLDQNSMLVATSEKMEVLEAIGKQLNRCEYFIMTSEDSLVFSSWERL